MVKYAKLINNYPSYAPNPILVDGNWIGNPPGSVYEEQGYKSVVYNDMPAESPGEGMMWSEKWTEDAEHIYRGWEAIAQPEPSADDVINYLFGGSGE